MALSCALSISLGLSSIRGLEEKSVLVLGHVVLVGLGHLPRASGW